MPDNKVCAFTGHRTIPEEQVSELLPLLDRAIDYAYAQGCRTFISGGAIGFDTLAARAVLRYRITHSDVTLIMYLPCLGQDEKWSQKQQNAYNYILKEANEVKYLSGSYTKNCMMNRNKAMATDADILIAYVSHGRSGSAQTARMAEAYGKQVYNLYPTVAAALGKG